MNDDIVCIKTKYLSIMPYTFSIYLGRQFIYYFFTILLVVAAIILLFDAIELMRVMHSKTISLSKILQLAMLKNLDHVQRIMPFVALIASVILYSRMTKSNELIVARSIGLSSWQFLAPSLIAILLFGLINITILNPITVYMLSKYEKLEATHLKGQASLLALSPTGLWIKQFDVNDQQSILHALRVIQEDQEIYDITFYMIDNFGKFQRRIDAENAKLKDGYWEVYNAVVTSEKHNIVKHDEMKVLTNLSFKQIQESVIPPETISFWKLPSFIEIAEQSGLSAVKHRLYFYKIFISPVFMLSMVLIGAAFAMSLPRTGRAGKQMMLGLLVGFFIYFLSDMIFAFGLASKMPAILAAFSPTALCLIFGSYMQLHMEDS
jgi:lipopolysaccharide export system permease protein